MNTNFNSQANLSTLFQFSDSIENLVKSTLNCCRVAIVEEFNVEELTAKVQIVNKLLLGINKDGSQDTMDYPPIYAKVCFGNPNITTPLSKGVAGILLFSDREIESYFINGDINNLRYERMHDITDALFIPACYSFVDVDNAKLISDCLHLFKGNSDIQVKNNQININTANIIASNTVTAQDVVVTNGASGSFVSNDGKTITVTNGIVTSIV